MRFSTVAFSLLLSSGASAFQQNPLHGSRVASGTQLFARQPFITGNWKLNPQTKQEAVELATGIANAVSSESPCDVGLFVPFPFIESVHSAVGDKLVVGAEMVTPEMAGAFTGGISPG